MTFLKYFLNLGVIGVISAAVYSAYMSYFPLPPEESNLYSAEGCVLALLALFLGVCYLHDNIKNQKLAKIKHTYRLFYTSVILVSFIVAGFFLGSALGVVGSIWSIINFVFLLILTTLSPIIIFSSLFKISGYKIKRSK